jgi:hypothetical protein
MSEKCPSDKLKRELRKLAAEIRREKHTAKVCFLLFFAVFCCFLGFKKLFDFCFS